MDNIKNGDKMEPIKAGIIGFGRVAGNHLNKMRETGLYDVVGVCDITESRREAAKAEGMQATDSLDDFLNWDIELVLITTHSSAHYADALKVAKAKKHMLIEKPLAIRGHEAEEMVQAAKDNGVVLTAPDRLWDMVWPITIRRGALQRRQVGARCWTLDHTGWSKF
jgi:scyllo-inositol 2-dehydrogenase (NADP+)